MFPAIVRWQIHYTRRHCTAYCPALVCWLHCSRDRTLPDMLDVFDIDRWLTRTRPAELHVSQPYQVACWTKESVRQGSIVRHGDNTGEETS